MATRKTESRSFQIRTAKENDFKIEGYAATFGVAADIGGFFKEIIAPGAFARSLAARADIHATVQHDFSQLLGRTTNSSLELVEDDKGLRFSIQLDQNVAFHKDVYANVKSGLLNECSFIFEVGPEGQVWSADGTTRTLTDVNLIEISLVALPAYSGTSADARALRATTDSAELLAKVAALPLLWKQQERAHELGLEIIRSANTPVAQKRSADDEISDEDFDDAQQALLEKFGRSENGHAPAHWLLDMDNSRCRTLHMDSQVRCRCEYTRDSDDVFDFSDIEPDSDYAGMTGDRAAKRLAEARQIQADSELRQRMAVAAGRSYGRR
jgi:HK97 family phage prohead protease